MGDEIELNATIKAQDTLPTQSVSSGGGQKQKTSATYDSYGHKTSSTDVNNTTTSYDHTYYIGHHVSGITEDGLKEQRFAYNSSDRLSTTSMSGLASQSYNYANGQLSSLARKSRVGTGAFTWQSYHFAYDPFGNMTQISVSGADNTATSTPSSAIMLAKYQYESGVNNGRLQKMTFGNGQTVQYSYDIFDRTTKEQYNNVTYEYAYDAAGQLAKQSSTAGEEYNYEYDSLGRLIRSNEYSSGTFEQRTEHVYDASDRLTKQSWYNAGGTTTLSYAYNATTGLLDSLTAALPNGWSIPVTYAYQGANQLRSKAIGSVMTKAYNFRSDNGYATALPNYVNYRDSSGNLIYGDNCYYDSNGRLIKILDSGSSTTTRATYGYDQQGQLTSAMVGGTSYTYTYDTAGNIQSKKVGSTTTNYYTYGNSAWRDLLTAYGGNTITYSGGNPTKYYDGSTFTWTQGRRLATAKVGGTNISYTYDMAGVRSSKTVGSTTYDFTTLSGLVTRQTGGGKTIDFVYDENNQPLAMKYNNTLYYYVLNAQGDVIALADQNGNLIAKYSYDPWGKLLSVTPNGWLDEQNAYYLEVAEANPLRYRGYYYDAETGFYYLQSRYYDPEIGRFINADSYASTDATGLLSTNMFAYCENDPVNRSDPSGEAFSLITIAVGATVGALVNAAGTALSNVIEGKAWNDGIGLALLSGAVSGAVSTISMNPAARLAISAVASAAESVYDQVKNDGSVNLGRLTADVAVGTISGYSGYIGNNLTGSFVKSGSMLKGQIKNAFKSKSTVDKLKRAGRNYLRRTLKLYKGEFFSWKRIAKDLSLTTGYNYASYRVWK